VEIEDPPEMWHHNIPKSVIFNTGSGKIRVGRGTSFGPEVCLLTGKHFSIGEVTSRDQFLLTQESGRDIIIGRHCFIGGRSIIIGPVKIGDYAVICAGAIVTKDVPERGKVAGPAARTIQIMESSI
jgi:acetyltransferase-like isoleucine patch superfamily enzyme